MIFLSPSFNSHGIAELGRDALHCDDISISRTQNSLGIRYHVVLSDQFYNEHSFCGMTREELHALGKAIVHLANLETPL
jgi:hypothetical protein